MASIVDSRRLTGPNRLLSACGCVIDLECSPDERERLEGPWREHVSTLLGALGWPRNEIVFQSMPMGASLGFVAPIDALYAATEVNECALEASIEGLSGEVVELGTEVDRLRKMVAREANPKLMALRDAALENGVPFLSDDDECSVGYGVRSRTWSVTEIPDPETLPWTELGSIPVLLVTGTNGKTTTVRLLAAIAKAAGMTPGFSSTDGIWVGDDLADSGDYSGPGGARTVLRDRRVEFAVLETARGGLLRRGVAVERADASAVLNVSEDHLGEFGVHDLAALCETKFLVTRVVDGDGTVVLNADDSLVLAGCRGLSAQTALFSVDAAHPSIAQWCAEKKSCAYLDGDQLVLCENGSSAPLMSVSDVPIALGGAARYNVSNALAAMLMARSVGIGHESIALGLSRFSGSPEELPGRTNRFSFGDVTVLVDFAHNPHGHKALLELAKSMPARRWGIVLGQAGDRDDESIRELTRLTHDASPDRIFVKEMTRYLRGRKPDEVPRMIRAQLDRLGNRSYENFDSELAAVRAALLWAQPQDLVILPVHEARDEVLELMERLSQEGWVAGRDL